MAIKEKDIRENPKYNKKKNKMSDSKLSSPNLANSKFGEPGNDLKNENSNSLTGYEESNNLEGNSSSLNSSVNISNLNKTSRVQHNMSIFQRNFAKISPII